MCGRFTLHLSKQALASALREALDEAFGPSAPEAALPDSYEPEYNVGPGREILALALPGGDNEPPSPAAAGGGPLATMHWGLRTPQNFHVNARIETADTSPRFRDGWESRRCLVPADGFYEWYEDGIQKRPHYFFAPEGRLLFFAGLWFPSRVEAHPSSCVLLTAAANASVCEVHHRMPVILPPARLRDWLENRLPKAAALDLATEARLDNHRVSQRVNSVRNNDSRLIEVAGPLNEDQLSLF